MDISDTPFTLVVRADRSDSFNLGDRWTQVSPQTVDGDLFLKLTHNDATLLISGLASWQNTLAPNDVNFDGIVSPVDVLIIFNRLNELLSSQLPAPTDLMIADAGYLDVNGDGFVTPLDALIIINFLNSTFGVPADTSPTTVAESEGDHFSPSTGGTQAQNRSGVPTALFDASSEGGIVLDGSQDYVQESAVERGSAGLFSDVEWEFTDLGLDSLLEVLARDRAEANGPRNSIA